MNDQIALEDAQMLTLLTETYKKWNADHVPVQAAALAYYTIFSIAPLLLVIISIIGLFFGRETAQRSILLEVQKLIGDDSRNLVDSMLNATSQQQSQGIFSLVVGLIALLGGATGVFAQLQQTLNIIWKSRAKENISSLVRVRIISFGLILVSGFLLLVSLFVSAAVTALVARVNVAILIQIANFLVSTLVTALLFGAIFKFLPSAPVPWKPALQGGLFTAVLFNIGKLLIGLYLGRSAVASTYGAAGSLVVMLLWIYFSAQIILFGAEFTQVLTDVKTKSRQIQTSKNQTRLTPKQHPVRGNGLWLVGAVATIWWLSGARGSKKKN
jgi:membrane protein